MSEAQKDIDDAKKKATDALQEIQWNPALNDASASYRDYVRVWDYDTYGWDGPIEPTDTCTYEGSGDWEVDIGDNCNITDVQNATGNNLIITGDSGSFTIGNSGQVIADNLAFKPSDFDGDARISVESGGKLDINS